MKTIVKYTIIGVMLFLWPIIVKCQAKQFCSVGFQRCYLLSNPIDQEDTIRSKWGTVVGYGISGKLKKKIGWDFSLSYSYQTAYWGNYAARYVGPPEYFVYGPDLSLSRKYNLHYIQIRPSIYFVFLKKLQFGVGAYYGRLLFENSRDFLTKKSIQAVDQKNDFGLTLSLSYKFGSNKISVGGQLSLSPFEGNFEYGRSFNTFPLTYTRYFNSKTKEQSQ